MVVSASALAVVMMMLVPATALAVVMVVVTATVAFIIVDFVDKQVIVVFSDQLDGGIDLDKAEVLCVLEQGGAVAGQDVIYCRAWHGECTT